MKAAFKEIERMGFTVRKHWLNPLRFTKEACIPLTSESIDEMNRREEAETGIKHAIILPEPEKGEIAVEAIEKHFRRQYLAALPGTREKIKKVLRNAASGRYDLDFGDSITMQGTKSIPALKITWSRKR